MFDIILKGILLLSPISYGTEISLNLFDMIFFRTGTIALFIASLWERPKREINKKAIISIVSLLIFGFINIFINTFRADVMTNYLNLFFGCLALTLIIRYADEPSRYYKWIIYAGFINIAVFLLQRIGINPVLNTPGYADTTGGILGNSPRLTIYLGLISAFNIWLALGSFIIALITKQYSLLAVLWLLVLMRLKIKREKILWIVLLGVGIFLVKTKLLYSLNFRWQIAWYPLLVEYFKRPLLGYGLGVNPITSSDIASNSYLQFITGAGIGALAWLIYTLRNYLKDIFKKTPETLAVLSLLLLMTIEYPIEIPRLWFTIIAIIGFFIIKTKGELNADDNSSL